MKRRKRIIAIAIVFVLAGIAETIYFTRRNPAGIETPEWWLAGAMREFESATGNACWRLIVEAYVRAGNVEQAKAAVERIISNRPPSRVSQVMDSARDLLSDVGIGSPTPVGRQSFSKADLLAAIARVQARNGDIRGALATAEEVVASGAQAWHLVGTYSAIARAQARAGDYDKAMETAKNLREDYPQYGNNNRSQLIAILHAEKGDVAAARATLEAIESPSYPSYYALRNIAIILGKRGDRENYQTFIRLTEESLSRRAGSKPRWVLTNVSRTQARAGDLEGASATMDRIVDAEVRLTECAELGWWFDAVGNREVSQMYYRLAVDIAEKNEITPETAAWVANAHAALGNIEAAMAVAEGITDAAQESYANHSIAVALAKVGDFEAAKACAEKIMRVRMLMAYRQIAKVLAKADRLSELLTWIGGLPTPQERAHAYIGAAQGIIEKKAQEPKRQPQTPD